MQTFPLEFPTAKIECSFEGHQFSEVTNLGIAFTTFDFSKVKLFKRHLNKEWIICIRNKWQKITNTIIATIQLKQ